MPHTRRLNLTLLAALALLLAACRASTPTPTEPPLKGGILATFAVGDERFKVWVTNPATIQQILDLESGKSRANIPNGRILRGPGEAQHNAPYDWHLDPQEIEMAEMAMEVCDGTPSFVQGNVGEFVDTVQRFCPWGARLLEVQDFR